MSSVSSSTMRTVSRISWSVKDIVTRDTHRSRRRGLLRRHRRVRRGPVHHCPSHVPVDLGMTARHPLDQCQCGRYRSKELAVHTVSLPPIRLAHVRDVSPGAACQAEGHPLRVPALREPRPSSAWPKDPSRTPQVGDRGPLGAHRRAGSCRLARRCYPRCLRSAEYALGCSSASGLHDGASCFDFGRDRRLPQGTATRSARHE